MGMRFVDAETIGQLATFPTLVDALEEGHRIPTDSMQDMLLSQPATNGGTDNILIRAAWQRQTALGAKLATVFPANAGGTLPSVQGVYVLFDGTNGTPLSILDGTELTYWKTAADSALGSRCLSRENATELLIVGAGALAPHLIKAHCAVRSSIQRVTVWNRTPEKALALAKAAPVEGVVYNSVADLQSAVEGADIISCATMSELPLVLGSWLQPGQHLDLVGGYTATMRECDDEAITRARVFVDSRETTMDICGDIARPLQTGALIREDIEADLYDLCQDGLPGPRDVKDITLYKNGGGAHLDLMTARYVFARLNESADA